MPASYRCTHLCPNCATSNLAPWEWTRQSSRGWPGYLRFCHSQVLEEVLGFWFGLAQSWLWQPSGERTNQWKSLSLCLSLSWISMHVRWGLQPLGYPTVLDPTVSLLKNPSWAVQGDSCVLFSRMGLPNYIPIMLISLLESVAHYDYAAFYFFLSSPQRKYMTIFENRQKAKFPSLLFHLFPMIGGNFYIGLLFLF